MFVELDMFGLAKCREQLGSHVVMHPNELYMFVALNMHWSNRALTLGFHFDSQISIAANF
jgi:hypothetical protein